MNNFIFYNPTKLIFGKGQIEQLTKQIPSNVRIMLTYGGGSIFKNGVYDQVKQALSGYQVIEFGGIEPNPTYETLLQAVEITKKEKIDFLLAVGGGSVLDGTKFIAAAALYQGEEPWDIASGKIKTNEALPLGAVLTLPATGSEMNPFSVVSRKQTQEKKGFSSPALFPRFSILDPETTFSLPDRQIANGIVDAFTHVMEQYMTFPVGAEIQDRFAESILITLIQEGPKTLQNPHDYQSRANFMWAATMALNGLIGAGVPQDWATHAIGHELTALHGIDHARTLAVVMPHLLHIKKENKKGKLVQYGQRVWKLEGREEDIIEEAIQRTIHFYESLGISVNASTYGADQQTIETIVSRFQEKNLKLGEKQDITPEVVREILTMSLGHQA